MKFIHSTIVLECLVSPKKVTLPLSSSFFVMRNSKNGDIPRRFRLRITGWHPRGKQRICRRFLVLITSYYQRCWVDKTNRIYMAANDTLQIGTRAQIMSKYLAEELAQSTCCSCPQKKTAAVPLAVLFAEICLRRSPRRKHGRFIQWVH